MAISVLTHYLCLFFYFSISIRYSGTSLPALCLSRCETNWNASNSMRMYFVIDSVDVCVFKGYFSILSQHYFRLPKLFIVRNTCGVSFYHYSFTLEFVSCKSCMFASIAGYFHTVRVWSMCTLCGRGTKRKIKCLFITTNVLLFASLHAVRAAFWVGHFSIWQSKDEPIVRIKCDEQANAARMVTTLQLNFAFIFIIPPTTDRNYDHRL